MWLAFVMLIAIFCYAVYAVFLVGEISTFAWLLFNLGLFFLFFSVSIRRWIRPVRLLIDGEHEKAERLFEELRKKTKMDRQRILVDYNLALTRYYMGDLAECKARLDAMDPSQLNAKMRCLYFSLLANTELYSGQDVRILTRYLESAEQSAVSPRANVLLRAHLLDFQGDLEGAEAALHKIDLLNAESGWRLTLQAFLLIDRRLESQAESFIRGCHAWAKGGLPNAVTHLETAATHPHENIYRKLARESLASLKAGKTLYEHFGRERPDTATVGQ